MPRLLAAASKFSPPKNTPTSKRPNVSAQKANTAQDRDARGNPVGPGSARARRPEAMREQSCVIAVKRLGSPPKHASADVADPDRNHQRDKGPLFDEER